MGDLRGTTGKNVCVDWIEANTPGMIKNPSRAIGMVITPSTMKSPEWRKE